MYRSAHKGLRFLLGNLLLKMGATSFGKHEQNVAILSDFEIALHLCDAHIEHEDRFVRPALATRVDADTIKKLDDEHAEHATQVAELRSLAGALLEATTTDSRESIGFTLYLHYSVFVAETLAHMAYEERVVQPLLLRVFSIDELVAIHMAIVGSVPPQEMGLFAAAMIPATNHEERVELLAGIQQSAPQEAFAGLMGIAKGALPANDFTELAVALDWK